MAALSRTDIQLRLEEASEKLLSRPQAVSTLERNEAEKIFLSLRAENSPYDLCQYLLENSRVDYVQFQALSAVREAFLREWESLPVDFIAGLWWYLLQFLTTQHQKLASYVLKETLHVISILVKRSMVHGKGVLQQVLSVVFDIIRGQKDSQHIGYSLLIALLSEFSSTTGPDQRGLSLQYCVQCKKALEEGEMKEVFSLILQVLKRIVTMTTEDLTANLNLISLVIELAHQILTWEFTGRLSTCKGFASQALYVVPLKPPSSWKDLISQPSIIELFFAVGLCPVVFPVVHAPHPQSTPASTAPVEGGDQQFTLSHVHSVPLTTGLPHRPLHYPLGRQTCVCSSLHSAAGTLDVQTWYPLWAAVLCDGCV
jgi:hypothetical protein